MAQFINFKPSDYFQTIKYTGDGGSTRSITGVGFQPDFLWCKGDIARQHYLCNSVIGSTYNVDSDRSEAEVNDTSGITSFDSDGFSIGSDGNGELNDNGTLQAGWAWKMGTTSGLSGGTITPTGYSINTTACQGVYAYTGTGSTGTIAHGLGKTPSLVLVKSRSSNESWAVYNSTPGYNSGATTQGGNLDLTLNDSNARTTSSNMWNDTNATDTLITVGAGNDQSNGNTKTYIMYVFCDVPGYSMNGQYRGTGNNNGPITYTGFEPAFIIVKNRDSGGPANYGWTMYTNKFGMDEWAARGDGNQLVEMFMADQASTLDVGEAVDFYSTGFKWYGNGARTNQSSASFMFIAFAKNPIVGKSNTPGTAR